MGIFWTQWRHDGHIYTMFFTEHFHNTIIKIKSIKFFIKKNPESYLNWECVKLHSCQSALRLRCYANALSPPANLPIIIFTQLCSGHSTGAMRHENVCSDGDFYVLSKLHHLINIENKLFCAYSIIIKLLHLRFIRRCKGKDPQI